MCIYIYIYTYVYIHTIYNSTIILCSNYQVIAKYLHSQIQPAAVHISNSISPTGPFRYPFGSRAQDLLLHLLLQSASLAHRSHWQHRALGGVPERHTTATATSGNVGKVWEVGTKVDKEFGDSQATTLNLSC